MIFVKRVYERFVITDGQRILVDRLWPRGLRRYTPNVDIWLKNVAPSNELRKWYGHEPARWKMFRIRYLKELKGNPRAVSQLIKIANATDPVTLVYSARDTKHNNAIVLRQFIYRKVRRRPQKGA